MNQKNKIVSCVGERIRVQRNKMGWTLKMLSEASGVPLSTIAMIERGYTTNPTILVIRNIALSLKLSTDYLIGIGRYEKIWFWRMACE